MPWLEELTSVGSKRCFGECSISFLSSFDTFSITSKLINHDMTLSFGFALGSGPYSDKQQYYR